MENQLPTIIIDLALILTAGGIITLLFKRLNQPVVLGYIFAGFLISPHFQLLPNVTDPANIQIWSQIGVIFLLFSLGLEFSFKRLKHVGGSASIIALSEVVGVGFLGFLVGTLLGWQLMDRIFLASMLTMTSTTIFFRTVGEMGLKTEKFVGVVFGTLIVEDLIAIIMMVLISTVASSSDAAQDASVIQSILKLVFFLVLWFVAGIFFIPTLLKRFKQMMNDETLLISALSLCLLMVVAAVQAGFSKELGAFMMGSILAETKQGERIEILVRPLKDLFGMVFFVSVGMLINPAMIVEHIVPIILLTFIVIFGKGFFVAFGAFLSGQPMKTAVQTGMSMAQIGEFSFIIATLGLSLGVISDFLHPIAVAVSAITTLTTPYLIKGSLPFYEWLDKKMPERLKNRMNDYTVNAQSASATKDWQELLKIELTNTIVYSVIIISLIVISSKYLLPIIQDIFPKPVVASVVTAILTLAVMSPFLWALIARNFQSELRNRLLAQEKYRRLVYVVSLAKFGIALFFIVFTLRFFFSDLVASFATIIILFLIITFKKRIQRFYYSIEDRFKTNLNAKEIEAAALSKNRQARQPELAPWDAHIAIVEITANSPIVGKKLKELKWREELGVNIACIQRGDLTIQVPTAEDFLYPYDHISVIGTDDQMAALEQVISPSQEAQDLLEDPNLSLQAITVTEKCYFANQTIRESGIKPRVNGIIVGLEHDGVRYLNPDSTMKLNIGDIVWIVGDIKKINELKM